MTQSFGFFESILDLGAEKSPEAPESVSPATEDGVEASQPAATPPLIIPENLRDWPSLERPLDPNVASARFIECCKQSIEANTPKPKPQEDRSHFFENKGFSFSFGDPAPTKRPVRPAPPEVVEKPLSAAEAARQRIMTAANRKDATTPAPRESWLPPRKPVQEEVVSRALPEPKPEPVPEPEVAPVAHEAPVVEEVKGAAAPAPLPEAPTPEAKPVVAAVAPSEPAVRFSLSTLQDLAFEPFYPSFALPEGLPLDSASEDDEIQDVAVMDETTPTAPEVVAEVADENLPVEDLPVEAVEATPAPTAEAPRPARLEFRVEPAPKLVWESEQGEEPVEMEAAADENMPDESEIDEEPVTEVMEAPAEVSEIEAPAEIDPQPAPAPVEPVAEVAEEEFVEAPLVEKAKESPVVAAPVRKIEVSPKTISVVDVASKPSRTAAKPKAAAWDVFRTRLGEL